MKKYLVVLFILTFATSSFAMFDGGDKQSQQQGQFQQQGQAQGQIQWTSTSIGNGFGNFSPKSSSMSAAGAIGVKGNINADNTYINEDKRELPVNPTYQRPDMGDHRGPFPTDGLYSQMLPWAAYPTWSREDISGYPSAGTVTKGSRKQLEPTNSFTIVPTMIPTEGYDITTILVEGDAGDTPMHLWGKAAREAMDSGATKVSITGLRCFFATKGKGWNIGAGGGLNVINGGKDNYGGSVGGGTGYGRFEASPAEKCSLLINAMGPLKAK